MSIITIIMRSSLIRHWTLHIWTTHTHMTCGALPLVDVDKTAGLWSTHHRVAVQLSTIIIRGVCNVRVRVRLRVQVSCTHL